MKLPFWLFASNLPLVSLAWRPRVLIPRQQQSPNICPTQVNVASTLAPTVNGQPVVVLTSVTSNTIFTPSPYDTPITITDAPTYLNTTVTAYITTTKTIVRTYITISSDYSGTALSTSTVVDPSAASDAPQTVYVFSPRRYAIVTSVWSGTTTSTTTIQPTASGQSGTVVVYAPAQYTTVTSTYSGSTTSITTQNSPTAADQTGTVVIYSPQQYTTTTTLVDGTTTTASTAFPTQSGGQTTVFLGVPRQYNTITSQGSVGSTVTSTSVYPSVVGQTGTLVIFTPQQYTTTTTLVDGTTTTASTALPSQSGGQTTVFLGVPRQYNTITSIGSVASTVTSTSVYPTVVGQTGTLVIFTPQQYTTTTTLVDGTTTTASTALPSQSGGQTTVYLGVPRQYTTLTSLGSLSSTVTSTSVYPTVVGQTGTLVLSVPPLYITQTSLGSAGQSGTITATPVPATAVGQTGTVVLSVPPAYTTQTSLGTAGQSGTITSTPVPATAVGQTGTIVLSVPPAYTTQTSLGSAGQSGTVTVTPVSATAVGQTGTVVLSVPPAYTTQTSLGTAGQSGTITATPVPATAVGQTGTVVLSVPPAYTTQTSLGTAGQSGTVTATPVPATAVGQTGTVVLSVPPAYTTQTSLGTAGQSGTVTATPVPATAVGQTGTVVLSVPPAYTTQTSLGTAGQTGTVTATPVPATAVGQTGTVVLSVPPAYTTLTSLGAQGATTTVTVTSVAATAVGQTGTVVLSVPPLYTTISSVDPTGTATYTITSVLATAVGQTGTLVVEVPATYTTVTTPYSGTVTSTSTSVTPTVVGQQGTKVLLVPRTYTTVTSVGTAGSVIVTSTQFTPTVTGQVGTVVVQYPPLNTITVTSGTVAYTSTVTTVVSSTTSLVAVVNEPWNPYHIFVTDFNANPLGYLQVATPGAQGVTNATIGSYASGSQFYLDPVTGQLAVSVLSGVSSTPLYSVVAPNSAVVAPLQFSATNGSNVPVSASLWPEGTIHVINTQNANFIAYICNGVLEIGTGSPAGCTNAVLTLTRSPATYITTTTTTGSTSSVRTSAATGTTVSNNGTVTSTVPTPTCTLTGLQYTAYNNPYTGGATNQNPNYNNFNSTPYNGNGGAVLFSGVTTPNINFNFPASSGNLYGTTQNIGATVLVYTGYFKVPTTGTYQIGFQNALNDDVVYIWMGAAAQNNVWSESNFYLRNTYQQSNGTTISYNFVANQIYPITILFANTYGQAVLAVSIIPPSGIPATDTTGYFVQPGCSAFNNVAAASAQPVAPICSAKGFSFAGYTNPYQYASGQSGTDPYYIGFNPSYFANPPTSALFSGVFNGNANFNLGTGSGTLYGVQVNLAQVAIVYRGYFVVPTTGTWQLNMPFGDDITYFWVGAAATGSGWGENNYNLRANFNVPPKTPYSQNFIAGQLYPMVILMANGAGGAVLDLTITNPTGTVFTDTSQFFYQPSCSNFPVQSASVQPSVTACPATGIEYINRPNPTSSTTTISSLVTPVFFGAVYTTTVTQAVTRTFNPNDYNPPTATPYSTIRFEGVTNDISFGSTSPAVVYGFGPYDFTQSVTFLRGYILPNTTGSYTFAIGQPDDVGYLWLGSNAVSGWNVLNANINGATVAGQTLSYTTTLTAGTLYPVRFAFANSGGAMSYGVTITEPSGVRTNTFGMFVQAWCGTTPYSSWT